MIQVTYQKKDGSLIYRIRNTGLPYKIGDITSMGWKVLNIEYRYKNEYYPLYKYNILINKDKQKNLIKKKTIDLFILEIKRFVYCFLTIVIINFIKLLLGI